VVKLDFFLAAPSSLLSFGIGVLAVWIAAMRLCFSGGIGCCVTVSAGLLIGASTSWLIEWHLHRLVY
jgi:hypothetical protein